MLIVAKFGDEANFLTACVMAIALPIAYVNNNLI
jgi:hypothetical protein